MSLTQSRASIYCACLWDQTEARYIERENSGGSPTLLEQEDSTPAEFWLLQARIANTAATAQNCLGTEV